MDENVRPPGSLPPESGSHEGREYETAVAIARTVHDAGGRGLIVGGWVRDRLMGHPSKDIDIEVFGLDAVHLKEILQRVGSVNTVGESFTVYKVAGLDVSIPRRESKTGRGHKGFLVTGDPALSYEEAARRRDFTINAISWDPLTAEYVDPFDGRGDIERRILRAVDAGTFASTWTPSAVPSCDRTRTSVSFGERRRRLSTADCGGVRSM